MSLTQSLYQYFYMSISEQAVHWIISDRDSGSPGIPSVLIQGAVFINKYTIVTSYGLISFKHCWFSGYHSYGYFLGLSGYMSFFRSQFEAEPGLEMTDMFHNNNEELKSVIDNCEILGNWNFTSTL